MLSRGRVTVKSMKSRRVSLRPGLIYCRHLQSNSRIFNVSHEIREAVQAKRPIVALESTIYTHGLPYPDNLRLASRLEEIIRVSGGVPATIGVLDGVARVGLDGDELARLVERPGPRKISRRDFALASADPSVSGGTTIAGTMILAHLAGIKVFATGGLGGVHRGGQESLDISADLTELGRTPVAVICSGCKGFLDIGRTLEYLETHGVGVATFADGRAGPVDFPAFWSRDSGYPSPAVLRDENEAARVINAQMQLPVQSGLLFANPVPQNSSIPRDELDAIIDQAIRLANDAGAHGSANTPFVLRAIKDLSDGRSVNANEALVEANVLRATKVAVALSTIEQDSTQAAQHYQDSIIAKGAPDQRGITDSYRSSADHVHAREWEALDSATISKRAVEEARSRDAKSSSIDVMVAGSTAIDTACDYRPWAVEVGRGETVPQAATSNPASITQSLGGVGANIARAAQQAGVQTRLCTVVADDHAGNMALDGLKRSGLDCYGIHVAPSSANVNTAQYVAINDAHKQLIVGMADMDILEKAHGAFSTLWSPHLESLQRRRNDTERKPWLIVDANWHPSTLHQWLAAARKGEIPVAFEPVSIAKASRLFHAADLLPKRVPRIVDLASPNELELTAMHDAARHISAMERTDWWQTIDALGISSAGARSELIACTSQSLVDAGVPQRSIQLLPFTPNMLTKLGSKGVLLTRILLENDPALQERYSTHVVARSKTGENGIGGLYMRLFEPEEVLAGEQIVSVNGAGDTFLGALVAQLATRNDARLEDCIPFAQQASLLTLQSKESVSPEIKPQI